MALQLDYFYGNESEQFIFYRIPKPLFTEPCYEPVSVYGKVLYGLILDRVGLSRKAGWIDEDNHVFVHFTLKEAMDMLSVGKDKAVKLFKELEDIGLIERKKQGMGKPTIIYVKNFIGARGQGGAKGTGSPKSPSPTKTSEKQNSGPLYNADLKTSDNQKSRGRRSSSLDFGKTDSNDIYNNDIDVFDIYPSIRASGAAEQGHAGYVLSLRQETVGRMDEIDFYREQIKENISYDAMIHSDAHKHDKDLIDGYVELMAETCISTKDYQSIAKSQIPTKVVKKQLLSLTEMHIDYVLECMKDNHSSIRNIRNYTLTALFCAPATIDQYYYARVLHDEQ